MPGHSRRKDGVASLAYVPGIHAFLACRKAWMAGTSPAMTKASDSDHGPWRKRASTVSPA